MITAIKNDLNMRKQEIKMKEIYMKVVKALVITYGEEDGFNILQELINTIIADIENHKLKVKRA